MENGSWIMDPNEDAEEQMKNFIFASLISADNDQLDEQTKQEIITRYTKWRESGSPYTDWAEILQPIKDMDVRVKYFKLLD